MFNYISNINQIKISTEWLNTLKKNNSKNHLRHFAKRKKIIAKLTLKDPKKKIAHRGWLEGCPVDPGGCQACRRSQALGLEKNGSFAANDFLY